MQHLLFFSALSWIQLQIFKNFNLDGHLDNIFCMSYFHNSEEIFNSDPRTFLWFHIVQAHPDVRCCTIHYTCDSMKQNFRKDYCVFCLNMSDTSMRNWGRLQTCWIVFCDKLLQRLWHLWGMQFWSAHSVILCRP